MTKARTFIKVIADERKMMEDVKKLGVKELRSMLDIINKMIPSDLKNSLLKHYKVNQLSK